METNRRRALKTAFVYLLFSLFCALFGGVYEFFANGVMSFRMVYAFAIPLVGAIVMFVIYEYAIKRFIKRPKF
jgi:uncharacterized membrane-anchored protein